MTRVQKAGVGDPLKAIAAGPLGLGEDETLFAGATFEDGVTDPLVCFRTTASALQFCFRAALVDGGGVFSFEFIRPVPPYTIPYTVANPDPLPCAADAEVEYTFPCNGEHRVKITFTPSAAAAGSVGFVDGSQV